MAEAAIFHLQKILAVLIQDEINLLSELSNDIKHIRGEFERMTTFLGIVEANKEHHEYLEVCVRQVREASYEAGDVLEQFRLQLNRRNSNGIFGCLRNASNSVMTVKIRHQVATEVKKIRSNLGEISQGYERYRSMLDRIEPRSGSQNVHDEDDTRGEALLLKDHEIVGLERHLTEIIGWLGNKDNRLQVHSFVGMGGMGKTTLVRRVFDNKKTRKIFESYAWITVSTYDVDELLKDVIRQLFQGVSKIVPEEVQTMNINNLKRTINDFLIHKRYLLVLDDVWNTNTLKALINAFPDSNCGSRMLLTTRIARVASLACNDFYGKVYDLKRLPEDEALTLFCQKAFQGQSCPPHLKEISSQILEKCEGLPLAVVAIGGLLATKDHSRHEWDMVYRTLATELKRGRELGSLQKVLLLSYIHLPYLLKICFLYLSIFPENYLMDHWRLVRLLVAEGFVEPEQGKSLEEVATSYLMELEDRSLILVGDRNADGTVKAYRIHGMWREAFVSKSMEQNLVAIAGAPLENKVRRMSVHDGFQSREVTKHFKEQLRSLLIFGSTDEKSALLLLASLRQGAKLLQVLDFRGSSLTTLPNKTLKLPCLKYLSLRGTRIKKIPKSIGNLRMLETLDLKDTLVTVLPNEISKLQRLRHLLVYRYLHEPFYLPFDDQIGFKAIKNIGNFSFLQKLCSIEINQAIPNNNIITEIGNLIQLRRLNILKVKSEDGTELCSSLKKLWKLRSLSISATKVDEIIHLESLSRPPRFLRTLLIKGRLVKSPHWISTLKDLTKLYLRYSKLEEDPLEPLQDLPNLAEILLEQAYEGELLSFKTGGFPNLKKLVLDSLSKLKQVIVIDGAMPKLEKLHIFGCALLNGLPSGIEFLSCLKDLQLMDLSNEWIPKLEKDVPNGDYQMIAHISKVLTGGSKDGRWRRHHF